MSYSLPAQLPDPDQHMHEVYLAAQAAAAAGNITQVGVSLVTTLHRFILQNQSTLLYRVLNWFQNVPTFDHNMPQIAIAHINDVGCTTVLYGSLA